MIYSRCYHNEEDDEEGEVHCHGYAWSEDKNHISSRYKNNVLFYVSMYDHLYQRGYVENILGSSMEETDIPMCQCIENMPPGTLYDDLQVNASVAIRHRILTPLTRLYVFSLQLQEVIVPNWKLILSLLSTKTTTTN